jgi:hypothetical protein
MAVSGKKGGAKRKAKSAVAIGDRTPDADPNPQVAPSLSRPLTFAAPLQMLNLTRWNCDDQFALLKVGSDEIQASFARFRSEIMSSLKRHEQPDTAKTLNLILQDAYAFVADLMKRDESRPRNYWPLIACDVALAELLDAQQRGKLELKEATFEMALFAQGMMNIAWQPARMRQAMEGWAAQNALSNSLAPFAKKGRLFKPGKPKGALSPLAKSVREYLVTYPKATADEVWGALSAKPPYGHTFCDNTVGRYIEYDEPGKYTEYRRFRNIVSEQRAKI